MTDVLRSGGASSDGGATTAVRTQCSYCGVGCGIVLHVGRDADGRRVAERATGDPDHPANAGRLCTKGVTSAEMLAAPGRMTTGLVRHDRSAEPVPCSTAAAVTRAATGLRRVLDEHGPNAVALYVSGQLTTEAQYLANKLAKGFIRTANIESNSRLCMASAGSGYKQSLGADGPPGSYDDIDHADVFLVIGSNMAECHPVLFLRLLDRVAAGATLIVVDPRRSATADRADLFLPIRPGTDIAFLNGLLHLIAADDRLDEAFIAAHTEGWEQMVPLLADYPPDAVAAITGIAEDDLRRAAALIGSAGNLVSCWTMGLNQSTHGTWSTNALCNLHLATGTIGRTGSGPLSLTGQPNAMGGREMGYMGPGLPGQRSALVAEDRRFVEDVWGLEPATIRTEGGTGTIDLFGRMADGAVKACWVIGTNPIASVANRGTVIAGLEAAELVVTQDAFVDTETNAYADVVLPAAMWAEGDGVMVNSERTVTLVPRAVDPPGDALPDWQLIAAVACEMGFADDFTYASAEDVFAELRRFANPATGYDLRGVTYERLRETPVQWPAAPGGPARNPIRYLDATRGLRFPTPTGRAAFHPRPHAEAAELPDDAHPFTFNTGRLPHQWHTMTKTGTVARLNRLDDGPFVEIHPGDAAGLGIAAGDLVEVASRRGRAVLPAVVSERVQPGGCFAPIHWNDRHGEYASVNAVTNDAVDPVSLQPELKVCAVALTKVATPPEVVAPTTGGSLAERFGMRPPVLTEHEALYVGGFMTALEAVPPSTLPVLPAAAPVSPAARMWVDGLLAGTFLGRGAPEPPDAGARTVTVIWASQTGNAQDVAGSVVAHLSESAVAARLLAMSDVGVDVLAGDHDVLVVTSTYGAGDPPDNGAAFWRALAATDAPSLDGVRYAVVALGDPSYADFCGHGRRLDERLAELGATRLLPRLECDPDFEPSTTRWLHEIVPALRRPPAPDRRSAGAGHPFQACRHGDVPTRATPLLARLADNRLLTGPGSFKEVRELVVDTAGSALTYEAGDSLGVWPTNCPDLVAEWLDVIGADADTVVDVPGVGALMLGPALRDHLEIARVTPGLIRFLAAHDHDRDLELLARSRDAAALARFAWGRQAVDVARAARVKTAAQDWMDVFTRLQPRQYSISSSSLVDPHRVRITASIVRYRFGERTRKGVCSTFLADSGPDATVPVFVQRAPHFRIPRLSSAPAVMIGPGTGIAPFLGFLAERRERQHEGSNWLFFGEQRRATDHYYRQELAGLQADGVLHHLDLAFSRDQRAKVYVQDRMREHGARLWSWLQDGAHVYVCGDMTRMAADVDAALHDIVETHGGLDTAAAAEYVQQLAAAGRYARDVY